MSQLIRTLKGHIRDEIIKKGGWVNAHAHADRLLPPFLASH